MHTKKLFIAVGGLFSALILGSLALMKIKREFVNPLIDYKYLSSVSAVEKIQSQKGKVYSYNPNINPFWNGQPVEEQKNFLSYDYLYEEPDVLGDTTGNWIEVDLSEQKLCFHETSGAMPCFLVSTGNPWTPTPTGDFHVWIKLPVTTMEGVDYYLPNIHWTMYFYRGYSTHEAYWHNNFGHPMSHGCVNMKIDDAKYIYDRSEVGTLVRIHD